MRTSASVLLIALVLGAGCAHDAATDAPPKAQAQLFEGMGPQHRKVSTQSSKAQAYFDQGLIWLYAFNHDEAIRSFERAAELDPSLAIAWWGVALAHGPHINNPALTEQRAKLAWEAVQRAERLKYGASPVERALIDAVAARYAWPAPSDRKALDEAYAAAMQSVHQRFPEDVDVTVLYAESLMDLQPWDLWTPDSKPKGRTVEIVALLESVIATNPKHIGATHLYIHAVEASNTPGRAIAAADALRFQVPASGHLTHMPSHIDARVGMWPAAAEANRRAIASDAAYRARSPQQDFYRAYMLHNQQFLSFVCMMLGREQESIASGKAAVDSLPESWVRDNAAVIDGYLTIYMGALKRFGRWDELLALEAPPSYLPYMTAMWRFNRALALAAQGKIEAAEDERERFDEAAAAVPPEMLVVINPASRVLKLARHVLDGEINYAKRQYAAAEQDLRAAVAIEDELLYMEPPDWVQPVRHTLGAVLIDAGRPDEAEVVYREDLTRWPDNGWSLLGLARAQEMRGKTDEARTTRAQLAQAWAVADITPHASCLCAPR